MADPRERTNDARTRRRPNAWRGSPHRISLGSLRWRLAAWVAVIVVISSAITFLVVYRGTADQLRGQIDHDLTGDSSELTGALQSGAVAGSGVGAESPARIARAARRYISSQSFTSTSTVLFVQVAGQKAVSNTPEMFNPHAKLDDGETYAEQAIENRDAARMIDLPDGFSVKRYLDFGELRVLRRTLTLAGGLRVGVGVAESLDSVARAQRGVARAFILAAALALLAALLGALLIGTRFSRPLRRMAAVAKRVDAGDLTPRIQDPGPGDEARSLADSFNLMLDRLTDAFAGQREFVADASHELRTPLTVIQGQIEVLAAQREPAAVEVGRVEAVVRAEIARMTRLVDDLLLLARAEQAEFLRPRRIALTDFVAELWDAVALTANRNLELGHVPAGTLGADPDRLAQALRNLLENAIEHTQPGDGLVRLRVEVLAAGVGSVTDRAQRSAGVAFLVEDDGPGIPPDQLDRVFDRFHRTDPARSRASGGVGLGLAIVRAIAEAHGGTVEAQAAVSGGALIELRMPGFRASASASPPRAGGAPASPPAADALVRSAPPS